MDILKRQYYLIDIFKFAFACLIIFLHINFGENTIIDIIRCFSHLGVPFFFVVSGFFMGKKLDNNKLINKFIKRLLLLFLFWTILYFPLIILPEIFSGKSIVTVLITYLQQLLFLAPSYLWYIVALIVATLIIYLLRNFNYKIQITIYVLLYIIGTLGNSYRGYFCIDYTLYYDIFLTTRNGLFFAPIFVFMGVLFSKNKRKYKNFKEIPILTILITFALLVFYIVESFLIKNYINPNDASMYFTLPLLLYYIFKIIISIDINYKSNNFMFLRNSSIIIYCSQFGFIFVYTYILKKILTVNPLCFGLLIYILTICSAIVLTFIIKKIDNKFLNKLI